MVKKDTHITFRGYAIELVDFFFSRELEILNYTGSTLGNFCFERGGGEKKQGSENKKNQSVTNFTRNIGETMRRMANMVTGKNGRDF